MTDRYPFRFDPVFRLPLGLLGVRPGTAEVTVDADTLVVRFGPWRLPTPLANVAGAERTGPYRWWKAVGPRLSLADGGVSFGSTTLGGACVRFVDPVPALLPGRFLRHPAVTVTVADPDALVARLTRA